MPRYCRNMLAFEDLEQRKRFMALPNQEAVEECKEKWNFI